MIQLALDLDLRLLAPDGVTETVLEEVARLHLEREEGKARLRARLRVGASGRLVIDPVDH